MERSFDFEAARDAALACVDQADHLQAFLAGFSGTIEDWFPEWSRAATKVYRDATAAMPPALLDAIDSANQAAGYPRLVKVGLHSFHTSHQGAVGHLGLLVNSAEVQRRARHELPARHHKACAKVFWPLLAKNLASIPEVDPTAVTVAIRNEWKNATTWAAAPVVPKSNTVVPNVDSPPDGPWSEADGPSQWAKAFGFSRKTFVRHVEAGIIRAKRLSCKSYQVHLDDLPQPASNGHSGQ